MLTDRTNGYGVVTIALHWLSALAVFFLFGLGLYMVELSYYDPWYHKGPSLHVSVGLCLLLATAFRLLWRRGGGRPGPVPGHGALTRAAASGAKITLYLGLLTILVTGYLITTAKGQGPMLFGWLQFPVILSLSPEGVDRAGALHRVVSWGVVILALCHGLAAAYYQFIHRDGTLLRMLKPVSREFGETQDNHHRSKL